MIEAVPKMMNYSGDADDVGCSATAKLWRLESRVKTGARTSEVAKPRPVKDDCGSTRLDLNNSPPS